MTCPLFAFSIFLLGNCRFVWDHAPLGAWSAFVRRTTWISMGKQAHGGRVPGGERLSLDWTTVSRLPSHQSSIRQRFRYEEPTAVGGWVVLRVLFVASFASALSATVDLRIDQQAVTCRQAACHTIC
ncbi:hypothetical protein LZ32DRAFT_319581 [Colletotrichum eremochloae]|nr:hypothetical protein LZ32DRAFT_319581 [Colletotrichum eremochloae]